MRRTIIMLLVAIGLVSFTSATEPNFTITGTAAGIENGRMIILEKQHESKGLVAVDSAKVTNGKFALKGNAIEPSIHFLQVRGLEGKLAFVLEKGQINFTIFKDSIAKSKIGGTLSNDDLHSFNSVAAKIQAKMQAFQQNNNDKMMAAQASKDEAVINQLMTQFNALQDELIALTSNFPEQNPKSFLSVLLLDNMFNQPQVDIEKIKRVYNNLDPALKTTKPGKAIKTKIDNFKAITVGSVAPEFSGPTPDGKMLSLKESLGKVTIIDFWASWCGPCRKENPSVVALYNEFHAKGLNIIGVSLDKDKTKWTDAIAKDGLVWNHVSNLKFWEDPIGQLYNIKSIPATFILDAKGNIIARDLRGAELRAKVAELLN